MGVKEEFKKIQNINDLALFLDINVKELNFLLYARNKKNYTNFKIPKKDGNYREIYSPKRQLKYVQRKLLNVFYEFYSSNSSVYGFLKNKSIVDNSKKHIGKKCVINIDLKDFFTSITFYRINGLLQKNPFNFKREIAIIISNLLTYNNFLPQGAPTSPLLSNFICRNLDKELSKYAKIHDAIYTRYADDITFSVNNNADVKYFIDEININVTLKDIIERNGFKVNTKKVRKSYMESHQEVTGIVVNKKPNINKNYYYKLRSMIHAWEKFGLEDAAKEHCQKIKIKYSDDSSKIYKNKVIGMLNYFKMVCSSNDLRYIRLASQVNNLCKKHILKINYDFDSLYANCVYNISTSELKIDDCSFGTAFKVKDFYITCRHCIFEENERINYKKDAYIFKNTDKVGKKIRILYVSEKNDFVIFDIQEKFIPYYFQISDNEIKIGDNVTIIGFPDYIRGDNTSIIEARITNDRRILNEESIFWVLDRQIQPGLSGGPVINKKDNKLIGMIVFGSNNSSNAETNNGFIPIHTIIDEFYSNNEKY